ncbi:MAG: hypothetical protein IBJ10_11150, partial [Phycisphaerales bacterium]|nr:hypothetical protein [Phycisphaerales bacterium]
GGQEFVLVLRCPIGSAWERLDRTRRLLLETPFHPERGTESVALGVNPGPPRVPPEGGGRPRAEGVLSKLVFDPPFRAVLGWGRAGPARRSIHGVQPAISPRSAG